MPRHYLSQSISTFLSATPAEILGGLARSNEFALEQTQRDAWKAQIDILKEVLSGLDGQILFEYSIPRMGRRIDVVLVIRNVLFVLEFKVGEHQYLSSAVDQVMDYALDLKNFHETSHDVLIAPVLIATKAKQAYGTIEFTPHNDRLLAPVKTNPELLRLMLHNILEFAEGEQIDPDHWATGRYSPTPTIIEAAKALYNNHSVEEILRNDALSDNIIKTSTAINNLIVQAKRQNEKAICFVTGVPGAGKTLVGLQIATKHLDQEQGTTSVFLSGNGPLVDILCEALTRDKVAREQELGHKVKKGEVKSQVKVFIQNVHHFRDECLQDPDRPPFDHVAIFDEAQRAWDHEQTERFMRSKKNVHDFMHSEPEYLISCLDRHPDWAVIVCLVGGGQEINTGEAGISEWIASLQRSFPHWQVYISSRLHDSEYAAGKALQLLKGRQNLVTNDDLHLAVSMRSFRAEHLSRFVKHVLDLDVQKAQEDLRLIQERYPIVLTRNLASAKRWLRKMARGSERYGIIVSSSAQRLKPHAIDVKSPIDPVHWFLDGKEDIRSSYFLEDVATEFHVQGLELDWACVTWDADLRHSPFGWETFSFVGDKWQHVRKQEKRQYLVNAYRVLLTRARQGMVIVVPEGSAEDGTRAPGWYDCTYDYLRGLGLGEIG